MSSKFFRFVTILGVMVFLPNLCFAAGGIDRVNSFLTNLSVALYAIGAIVFTIALIWAGFKVMFQQQTLVQVAPTFIGGILVASASAIAGYMIN